MTTTKKRVPLWRIVLRLTGYFSTPALFALFSHLDLALSEAELLATVACVPAVAALFDFAWGRDARSC